MKILHICISGAFTEGMSYQENELVAKHVELGHDVTVIASTEVFGPEKKITYANPGISELTCGAKLIRLPYALGLKGWIATKIRAHRHMRKCIESLKPDRILFHGLTAWDLQTTAAYVRKNPQVKLFVDCHEDFNNSAMSWASRELLHKCFYKLIFRRSLSQISEVLCVTIESLGFAIDFYGSPKTKTRIFPLGGTIESEETIELRRTDFRARNNLKDTDIVITQTGKLDRTKKLVVALKAFRSNPSSLLKFIIAGQMTEEVKSECLPLIESDNRIFYLGWQTTEELKNVLAGADFFLQPFGQTVTTQLAMCYGCIILAQNLPSHRWLVGENGMLFNDASELGTVLDWVINVNSTEKITQLQLDTSRFAKANLDYRELALQIVK